MWMQSAVQNCAVVLGRDTAFSQLKAAWIIFLESNLSNKMHKDMIPQRYMFVWEGQILKMDETPESVGMGQAGPLEPIAVLDAADVWYGIGVSSWLMYAADLCRRMNRNSSTTLRGRPTCEFSFRSAFS